MLHVTQHTYVGDPEAERVANVRPAGNQVGIGPDSAGVLIRVVHAGYPAGERFAVNGERQYRVTDAEGIAGAARTGVPEFGAASVGLDHHLLTVRVPFADEWRDAAGGHQLPCEDRVRTGPLQDIEEVAPGDL